MPTKKYKLADGTRVPGVTTIIGSSLGWGKEALMAWAWKQGQDGKDFREERDKAADAGTLAHALAAEDIAGKVPNRNSYPGADDATWESAQSGFKAYLAWKEMSRLKIIHSEISFVHEKHRYGGTLDAVARFGERVELIDFKHTNGLYPEHIIQVSAYKELWENGSPFDPVELLGASADGIVPSKIDGVHLLRFTKGGDFHHSYYEGKRMFVPWMAFLNLRDLYDVKKAIEGMC